LSLLLFTLAAAIGSAYLLFKIYNFLQALTLKKMNWTLAELKSYNITPTVKMWSQLIETLLVIAILWKVFYT